MSTIIESIKKEILSWPDVTAELIDSEVSNFV